MKKKKINYGIVIGRRYNRLFVEKILYDGQVEQYLKVAKEWTRWKSKLVYE